uniref:peritrophin-1-like n=1 Tax=Osmia lignaria TaxID=473952 RepID=UPI0014793481|nr:peritrophin-1-like [Osmia lignaria]
MKGLFLIVCAVIVVYVHSQSIEIRCPEPVNDKFTLLPHPCKCNSYYVCYGVLQMSMPCPANLHFNATAQVCDWPWSAKCTLNPACPQNDLNNKEITP